ncbi:MAG: hypothetical protein KY461_08155 [Actinobacteria bacterium]|nr:hypothetical protein [Actinomycetota bacterium]
MRRSQKFAATALAGTLLATALGAAGAAAATGSTDSTLTLTSSGALTISVPDSSAGPISLGSTAVPAALGTYTAAAGTFGNVTVTDQRAGTLGWVATATGTDFCIDADPVLAGTQCSSDTNLVIPALSVLYAPGAPSVDLGTLSLTVPVDGTLAGGATVTYTGTGNSSVTWSPAMTFTLTATQVAGTYAGTVTHEAL